MRNKDEKRNKAQNSTKIHRMTNNPIHTMYDEFPISVSNMSDYRQKDKQESWNKKHLPKIEKHGMVIWNINCKYQDKICDNRQAMEDVN